MSVTNYRRTATKQAAAAVADLPEELNPDCGEYSGRVALVNDGRSIAVNYGFPFVLTAALDGLSGTWRINKRHNGWFTGTVSGIAPERLADAIRETWTSSVPYGMGAQR